MAGGQVCGLLHPAVTAYAVGESPEERRDPIHLLSGESGELLEGGDPQAVEQLLDDRPDADDGLEVVGHLPGFSEGAEPVGEPGDEALLLAERRALLAQGPVGSRQILGLAVGELPAEPSLPMSVGRRRPGEPPQLAQLAVQGGGALEGRVQLLMKTSGLPGGAVLAACGQPGIAPAFDLQVLLKAGHGVGQVPGRRGAFGQATLEIRDSLLPGGGLSRAGPAQGGQLRFGFLQAAAEGSELGGSSLQCDQAAAAVGQDLVTSGESLQGGLQALGFRPGGATRKIGVVDPELLHPPLLLLLIV